MNFYYFPRLLAQRHSLEFSDDDVLQHCCVDVESQHGAAPPSSEKSWR